MDVIISVYNVILTIIFHLYLYKKEKCMVCDCC